MKKIAIVLTVPALFSVAYYKINIYDNKKNLLESKSQVNKENINLFNIKGKNLVLK